MLFRVCFDLGMMPGRAEVEPSILSSRRFLAVVSALSLLGVALTLAEIRDAAPTHASVANCPSPAASYAGGNGSSGSPWLIDDSTHLQLLLQDSPRWGQAFRVTADIDMEGCTWTSPIGIPLDPFTGQLDGDGHVVSALTVTANGTPAGFVGYLGSTGVITDFGFLGTVSGTGGFTETVWAGGLVGTATSGAVIERSFAGGAVSADSSGDAQVGGLVGSTYEATITDSYSTASVAARIDDAGGPGGNAYAGGLVGVAWDGTLTDSYASGPVTASNTSGGTSRGGLFGSVSRNSFLPDIAGLYWDLDATGVSVAVVPDLVADVQGLTSSAMADPTNFTGWSISPGWDVTQTWGSCGTVNAGNPFLTSFYSTSPCTGTPQATLVVSGVPASMGYGDSASLAVTGGSGNGAVTYDVGSSTACEVTGITLTVTAPSGSCSVTATKAGDGTYDSITSAAVTVTVGKGGQAPLNVQASSPAFIGSQQTLSVTGGSGSGAVTYSTGASTACSVSGATLTITAASGTCTVTATKDSDINYLPATSPALSIEVRGFPPIPVPLPDPTPTPTPTPTPAPTPTPSPTPTPTPTPTPSPSPSPTPTPGPPGGLVPADPAGAQVIPLGKPPARNPSRAPLVPVPQGESFIVKLRGLPERERFVAQVRSGRSWGRLDEIRSNRDGRVTLPALDGRRSGDYLVRLKGADGARYFVRFRVSTVP